MNEFEYSLRSRDEGSGSRGGLDNGDIIAIVEIFASVIATVFGVWLLDKLRKRCGRSAAHEGLEANHNQNPSSHEPCSASVRPRQDLEPSTTQQITRATMMMAISVPEVNGSPLRPRAALDHPLEAGNINRPKRAYTWTADKTKH
ncbi:uncharacterized protein H6S33_006661 [Morchella sextelata]|uniref:uncharacterized protein n=1 Tax=Morchella sextelata TaxID=1174677 RepID=UPI001D043FB2|nr:uncharacterized protein H6S33_006661 [Morchella sextelata]KAH0604284.1 hypothetical protein H6S33_006661 [Morchella sextelata]